MIKGINCGVDLINDVSGFSYDLTSRSKIEKYDISKIIHHMEPQIPCKKPKYKNVLLVFMISLRKTLIKI